MRYKLNTAVLTFMSIFFITNAFAHIGPEASKRAKENRVESRMEACDPAIQQIDQAINNVRARLLTGGDAWWDGSNGRYVVPKVAAGQVEVSSIFAGAVWLGGVDPAGNLKIAAQTYGRNSGNFDFWPGPLDPVLGTIEQEVCAQWDRFFRVTGEEIDEHLRKYNASITEDKTYDVGDIPRNVRGWPARGNQFFFDVHGFELPNTSQGLAGFWDVDGDGEYNPDLGDYPVIEIRGCLDQPQYPDEMIFWVYNDAGNIHAQSQGDPIQMEIQVQAFSYATNDQINDMTFQRYKLINRAIESIDSTFFAMWVDPDLGCSEDDFVGCDTLRSMAFVYNADAADGNVGTTCTGGVATYGTNVPILGIDYFRGPRDENFNEIGMSSFTYFNRGAAAPNGTTDPSNAVEYYNYLSGSWKDGSPFTFGDDAYQDGEAIDYAFIGNPSDDNEWSMCSAGTNPQLDRRTVQASGPFRLDPGATNELIIGVVWIADQMYPCPDIRSLRFADDIAQALFDNCFNITDGPDAPDVDFIELDREIIAIFTNDTIASNNAYEEYAQPGLQIPGLEPDSLYRFEGYKLYQFSGPDVSLADVDDPSKVQIIYQVDINNGVDRVFNWVEEDSPLEETFYVPTLRVEGGDDGVRHTFRITEDRFATGDRRLINHKKYYFTSVAYAYNNYLEYDPTLDEGQRTAYLEGRKNIGDGENPYYTVIPRPIIYEKLNSNYGDGTIITRLDGVGVGGNFLDVTEETRQAILDGTFDGTITYQPNAAPIDIRIFNPLEVTNGNFIVTLVDDNLGNRTLESGARWILINEDTGEEISSEKSIESLNEEILGQYGFSITIGQTDDVGEKINRSNGAIGYGEEYQDSVKGAWLTGIADGNPLPSLGGNFGLPPTWFNFAATSSGEADEILDPDQGLTNIGPGYFFPYKLADYRDRDTDADGIGYLSPAYDGLSARTIQSNIKLADLNNVDIVFTSDKSKWSRCPIIETYNSSDAQFVPGSSSEGGARSFDLRAAPSVGKEDADGDGKPDPDGDGTGMGWFPGYAIDVETGARLNVFFGENSMYGDTARFFGQTLLEEDYPTLLTGRDMMFNPSSDVASGIIIPNNITGNISRFSLIFGARHYIYVTRQLYDEGEAIRDRLSSTSPFRKAQAVQQITWTAMPYLIPGEEMLPYADGLIPNDLIVKLRVDNPYQVEEGTAEYNGYPSYRFSLDGVETEEVTAATADPALDKINVAPNPYYGYSAYENSQFSTLVKITNLPAESTVTIYSLDGKFIRQYKRNEVGATPGPRSTNRAIDRQQINHDLEWDLKNAKGIPVASGVYYIHIDAGELGQRVIKWFGVARQFDPSGL